MKYKSFIAKTAIILILALSFINSYNKTSNFVYADATTDQWNTVTTNQELAEAFRYYCKSRNLAIDGSVLDGVTSFTTNSFNTICNTLGIDVTALQAHLKRSTDSNGNVQFLFDEFGVTAYNRIFAELLQNNDIEVGETVDNKRVYTGYYSPANNVGVFTIVDSTYQNTNSNSIVYYGEYWHYSPDQLNNMFSSSESGYKNLNMPSVFGVNSWSSYQLYKLSSADTIRIVQGSSIYGVVRNNGVRTYGYPSLIYDRKTGKFYAGFVIRNYSRYYYNWAELNISNNSNLVNVNVDFTTNNETINNNTYEDNSQTVINNEGDVYNYDYDDDDPPVNPGGGSGGGGDNTNINIDFPNFDFNIPDIDFSLKGLTGKFPFCIPFDMVALLQLLNAEPQAPRIQGQIPFGSFFTWNLDLDFSRFDDFAVIMRGLEFVGFIFFLIGATINIAKG